MLSGGYQVTNWKAIENKKLDKTQKKPRLLTDGKQKERKTMAKEIIEVGAEFVALDGSTCLVKFFKSSNLWNGYEVTRKILVSNVSGNPNGILDSTDAK